ncbi:LIF receptor subunit alpha a [Clupea harengus]|uniref:LIF receptor subunit alpha a n=1 Tax=Clupea harengus TaxID=7950 RepID=A0A6P3VY27_CLUHA|nr:LIF receptor subunit alpha a [Clupea harengus]
MLLFNRHLHKLPSMYSTLLCVLCLIFTVSPSLCQDDSPLDVPQQIRLDKDFEAQRLAVTWHGNLGSVFDIEIYRTEFMDIVFNETVELSTGKNAGDCHWNWTSTVPLECTSHSVRIRSRDLLRVSEWSPLQTTEGSDFPDNTGAKMYPVDKVVLAGTNTTFCCILGEGQVLQEILYMKSVMKEVRLSRRTYAVTQTLQPPSNISGTNVFCVDETNVAVDGAVIFVGYPPGDDDLICETQDLVSAVCQWKEGRSTHLWGRRDTRYTLNGRDCKIVKRAKKCGWEQWESNWTLVAKNPLGMREIRDSAPLSQRVHPVAPESLKVLVRNPRNATLQWSWRYQGYEAFPLICQVNVASNGISVTRNYSGAGLSLVLLEDLWPYETYRARVRCGSKNYFWKWGDWSSESSFRTKMDRPETPDMWIWMGSDKSGRVLWKPLSKTESHGDFIRYDVTQGSASDEGLQRLEVPASQLSVPLSLQDNTSEPFVTLLARNSKWASHTSQLLVPKYLADVDVTGSEISSSDGGFDMSWLASANASRGYAVEWFNTSCGQYCSVDWLKVPEATTSARIESRGLEAGVRYTISVYALSDEAPQLLERRHGYLEEMVSAEPVPSLEASQYESSVLLSWQEIPLQSQRGFVQGYNVYLANISKYTLLANITDPSVRNYTIRKLGLGTYKFTVRAYTSAGEDGGSTVSIKLEPYADLLLFEILIALAAMSGFFILVTAVCYRKRQWVKKAFYPEIPEPKLPGQWSTSQATLDVKPSPHSMVHIVENPQWDSSKEGLVPVSEEDEDGDESGSEPTDTDSDEPGLLRYYNHVMGDSGQAPRLPIDSSSSSVGSADTDVTYTGIQTSPCALEVPAQVEAQAAGGYRPQAQVVQQQQQQQQPGQSDAEPKAGAPSPASFGGYKPQCTWRPDSPDANGFDCSVGSPTSVNSSQFLIPDVSSEDSRNAVSSTTWIPSFMSGKP